MFITAKEANEMTVISIKATGAKILEEILVQLNYAIVSNQFSIEYYSSEFESSDVKEFIENTLTDSGYSVYNVANPHYPNLRSNKIKITW